MTVTERSPWRAGGFGISDYFKPLGVPVAFGNIFILVVML